jgi:hypothetical protein
MILKFIWWSPMADTCNPSYSRGRDQEDHGLKLAWANSSWDPILKKKKNPKRASGVVQGVGPEFKLQYCQNKTKFIWECREARKGELVLEKMSHTGGLVFPCPKSPTKVWQQRLWYRPKNRQRHTDQQIITENPEIYGLLIFDKGARQFTGGKSNLSSM